MNDMDRNEGVVEAADDDDLTSGRHPSFDSGFGSSLSSFFGLKLYLNYGWKFRGQEFTAPSGQRPP